MGAFKALLVFLLGIGVLVLIATGGQGIPVTGLFESPATLGYTAARYDSTSEAAASQANAVRTQQAELAGAELRRIRSTQEEDQRRIDATYTASKQQEVQLTREAWQVTVIAARVQETAGAVALATDQQRTQVSVNNTATVEALAIGLMQGQATQTIQVSNIELQNAASDAEVRQRFAALPTMAWYAFLTTLFGGALLYLFWSLKMKDDVNAKDILVDPATGRSLPQLRKGKFVNVDLSRVPVQDPQHPIQAADSEQLELAHRDQTLRAVYGANRIGSRGQRTAGRPDPNLEMLNNQQQLASTNSDLPLDVPWSLMDQWPGKKWTFGQGAGGQMISLDPDDDAAPHLLMAGTTGSGKTHYGLQPLIAQALAQGIYVIVLDRTGMVYSPFASHPNAHLILLDEPEIATAFMAAAYQETIRRTRLLAAEGLWKWSMLPNAPDPRVLIVMDEISDLADEQKTSKARDEFWTSIVMVAREGRKAGMLLAIALQDPTHHSIDLRVRRNCTRFAFTVQDAEASRVILGCGGAERLPHRHFMTVIGSEMFTGVAFDPSKADLQRFLAQHPQPALPEPAWLKPVEIIDPQQAAVSDLDRRIRQLYAQGKSLNEIQMTIFGRVGGSAFYAVKTALGSTTTTDSPGTGPVLDPA